jgi:hypothetical protein
MNDISQLAPTWQTFYLLTGTAATTLMGLLFVAMSLHTDRVGRHGPSSLQTFGALTFNCYFYVLLVAIIFVIPGQSPLGLGLPHIALGLLALLGAALQRRRASMFPVAPQKRPLPTRFTIPLIALAGLVLLGLGIAFDFAPALYGVVVVMILLLGPASQNAWALLTGRPSPLRDE